MIYFVLARILGCWFDLMMSVPRSQQAKDIEILLLRQQLRILQRKQAFPPRIFRRQKLTLAVLSTKWRDVTGGARARLDDVMLLFKPATVLKWHRELVRRKWTFTRARPTGRPTIAPAVEALILRLASENSRWGYSKIQGELLKLGDTVGRSTVRDVLKRRHVPPAPTRGRHGSTWSTFLHHHQEHILACDFFTVETVWLHTLYVLFFIELGCRRVHVAGCTDQPTAAWVTQQARHINWALQDEAVPIHFLIHDRDATFPSAFDQVFASDDVTIIRTPFRAPQANAFAERWVRSVREECLDQILILNARHLHRVLKEYVTYVNHARPHQGIAQHIPVGDRRSVESSPVHCRDVLGGIIHDYYREAA